MIQQIDVRAVLSRTVAEFHSDLVTRPTGRAVRTSIEAELRRQEGSNVVVLDFSAVRLIDWSCADEIVAKLLRASLEPSSPSAGTFFVIRGLSEANGELLHEVLERHQLALVADRGDRLTLLGGVTERSRLAFERLVSRGSAAAEELAADLAWTPEETRAALEELAGRRLVLRAADRYHTLPAA
jgi:hypothetical protein